MAKYCYDRQPGYKLHHTVELNPVNSVSPHLHYDTSLVLTYFKRGTGSIKIEGRLYEIGEGDVILLNRSELHCCQVNGDRLHERIVLYIKEALLLPFGCNTDLFFAPFNRRQGGCGNRISAESVREWGINRALEELLELVRVDGEENQVLALCSVVRLLALLKGHLPAQPEDTSLPKTYSRQINGVVAYLNAHFAEEVQMDDLARRFYISKYHLCRVFKEYVGITIGEYLTRRRLSVANELLLDNRSAEEACYQSGFRSYSNFFKLYQKYQHTTPQKFKQQVLREAGVESVPKI